jgi:carbamoyl-phosphate synthase large subunit
MVSEFLPGKEYAFQSVWHQGTLLMSQARERKEYVFGNLTPSGQSSSPSVAMTVHNQEVNELCTQAILAVDHQATGVFCVDMKTDKNNTIKVTEINAGRFFTTSYFFSQAGANMPYYYTKVGIDGSVEHSLKPYNNIPEGWYWIRNIDIGYKLIKGEAWTSKAIATS